MSAWLTMSLREVGRWPTLTVLGEINLGNIARFDAAIAEAAPRFPRLIVDLTAARLSGSAAISCLYRHADCLAAVVVVSGSTLSRALSLAPFLTIVTVEPTAHTPALPDVAPRTESTVREAHPVS